jgi:hypothetical protein
MQYIFCIDDESMPIKGVKGKGIARISENPKDNLPIMAEGNNIEEVRALMPRIREMFERYRQ